MRVLVNAASVKEGGPLVVLTRLLTEMRDLRDNVDWSVAVHPSVRLAGAQEAEFARVEVGNIDSTPFGVLRWYELGLPAFVKRHGADVVFSLTNYLPLRKLAVPTVLLVQHAGHFSREFDELYCGHLHRPDQIAAWRVKNRWVERSIRTATIVTVQTAALGDMITAKTARPRESVHVIAHGPGCVAPKPISSKNLSGRPVRIGYTTKWGVQKNFGVLFSAAARLIGQGRGIRVILTLADGLPVNARVIQQAKAAGLADVLENVGEVDTTSISKLYDSFDIFVFPSVVESFGFPLVEAMAKALPIVAADTPSNREIMGHAGLYFPPTDVEALVHHLVELIDNTALREAKSAAASRRAENFSWRQAAERTLRLFDAALDSQAQ